MYNDQYDHENTTDPLYVILVASKVDRGLIHPSLLSDEFFAQLLNDIPDVLPPIPTLTYASTSTSIHTPTLPFPSSSAAATATTATSPYYTTSPPLTCQWVSSHDLPIVCGEPLSSDPKHACTHFRHVHHIHGNEKVMVQCHWRDCHAPPMQRGSLIRHVLTVHLGLLRWQCEVCGRTFSRKWTAHTCD